MDAVPSGPSRHRHELSPDRPARAGMDRRPGRGRAPGPGREPARPAPGACRAGRRGARRPQARRATLSRLVGHRQRRPGLAADRGHRRHAADCLLQRGGAAVGARGGAPAGAGGPVRARRRPRPPAPAAADRERPVVDRGLGGGSPGRGRRGARPRLDPAPARDLGHRGRRAGAARIARHRARDQPALRSPARSPRRPRQARGHAARRPVAQRDPGARVVAAPVARGHPGRPLHGAAGHGGRVPANVRRNELVGARLRAGQRAHRPRLAAGSRLPLHGRGVRALPPNAGRSGAGTRRRGRRGREQPAGRTRSQSPAARGPRGPDRRRDRLALRDGRLPGRPPHPPRGRARVQRDGPPRRRAAGGAGQRGVRPPPGGGRAGGHRLATADDRHRVRRPGSGGRRRAR